MDDLFDRLFNKAVSYKVTDIHFYLKNELIVKMRIYGKLQYIESFDFEEGSKFINYLKYKSNINTNYRLHPQTGHFEYIFNDHIYHLRLSYLVSFESESVVIRILNQNDGVQLYNLSPYLEYNYQIDKLSHKMSGLIVISGPTGSGKTTTLYAIIDQLIKDNDKNIITIEDPVEVRKDGCLQIQINENLGLDYQVILKQILRHDPDVIMIGEIRDEKVAKIAITCALSGHLVLTTLHASSPYLALKRLMNLGISELDLIDVINASIFQRIEYDKDNKIHVMPQLMNRQQIYNCFSHNIIEYYDFTKKETIKVYE